MAKPEATSAQVPAAMPTAAQGQEALVRGVGV